MRIGLIWVSQETDTFNPSPTTIDHFASFGIERGQSFIEKVGSVGMPGGYLSVAAKRNDVETVPIFKARAVAGGRLSKETLDFIADEVREGLESAGDLDGLALQLHGACSAEGLDDVDGYLIDVARRVVGEAVPIVVFLDHHANITERMVELSDAIVGHRTQPHDQFDTGVVGAEVLFSIVDGAVAPSISWRKIPLISHQEQYLTSVHPMKTWFDRARELEEEHDEVVQISNFPMQPWLDVEEGGWSTVVVTNDSPSLGDQLAQELGDLAWSMREEFQATTSVSPREAVLAAESAPAGLVVISDTGDSVLGGAGGDSTILVREMLELGIEGPALVPIVDPSIGQQLDGATVGDSVSVSVGGSLARMHEPVELNGRLAAYGPTVVEVGDGYSSPVVDLGVTAVIEVACGVVVVTELPGFGGVHPALYRHFGIEPSEYKMAVVKTASNFQYFSNMTSEVIRANTSGPTQSDISELPWERIPRPVYPLEPISSWR